MQFSFHEKAGEQNIEIIDDLYKYLIKARRHKVDETIPFRNLLDNIIYFYKIISIDRKKAFLTLESSEEKIVENSNKLHLAWCVVDPKTIEKSIASLNELGLDKITFIYCEYSQKNFKINFDKLNKILINSSSQCGRSSIIKLEEKSSLDEFLNENPESYILDFSKKSIDEVSGNIETIILGCEGGFSNFERDKFNREKVIGFKSNLILKSETAAISAVSKILI
ncbi:16S rRNA (uracil(1498)-N(3))-methyltransferase [Halarcobacter sp.]|uniref:16S rRNA (uracil(1498)-N(3))-methyltransferase n=1 Tax=Halarcobacter sp. TaxID=2321133 RepID=UPI002AA70E55|nr:16S rRNA (uracil(1498)-N(3))-methyltransferase [Halarcobacter sp.]